MMKYRSTFTRNTSVNAAYEIRDVRSAARVGRLTGQVLCLFACLAIHGCAKTRESDKSPASLPAPATKPLNVEIVEGQPLAANVTRVVQALEILGTPLPFELKASLKNAVDSRDATAIQTQLDPHVLFLVSLNAEVRVKVARGPAAALLQQSGYTPCLVKIINAGTTTQTLNISSPQAGPAYAGAAKSIITERERQEFLLKNENTEGRTDRFLELEMFNSPPMTANLSGLDVEYAVALIYSSEAGKREATIAFDVGEGSQDLGFRGEIPILFDVRPAVPVMLRVKDSDGLPTVGRFTFEDATGRVYPPQAKRLAPDLFFQRHIYRGDGDVVLLPPGKFTMHYGRGPEYRWLNRQIEVPASGDAKLEVRLERWIKPMDHGYFSGDHHIHAAGCAHYTSPTQGVFASDMFRQVKGEGLNFGNILTWGPCFDFQQQFFTGKEDKLSEPLTRMKYDIEVSGFGSAALGHVCLLNLKEQIYPGANGSEGWPTWTTPVLRWAKRQGAVTGYAHSASGLQVNAKVEGARLFSSLDANGDTYLDAAEAAQGLMPEPFETSDANHDRLVTEAELVSSVDRAADRLPNLAIPELNSVGAQEIFVTVSEGVCDFISAMDTARLLEWNCWYHILNCGFPLKVSGETDFPCMSGTRVGQGRVYVQLGKGRRLGFDAWCKGIAAGNSYVSDGYAHALAFTVQGKNSGEELRLEGPRQVRVNASVAFSSETPLETRYGGVMPAGGARFIGDTVFYHEPALTQPEGLPRQMRAVEIVMNGQVVATQQVPADDQVHELSFDVDIDRSSWLALRHFPQLHTNPVQVVVAGQPIRASRQSALWCIGCIEQLWRVRAEKIAPAERDEAYRTFLTAIERYRKIANEAPAGS
jgi:hypothetical protein